MKIASFAPDSASENRSRASPLQGWCKAEGGLFATVRVGVRTGSLSGFGRVSGVVIDERFRLPDVGTPKIAQHLPLARCCFSRDCVHVFRTPWLVPVMVVCVGPGFCADRFQNFRSSRLVLITTGRYFQPSLLPDRLIAVHLPCVTPKRCRVPEKAMINSGVVWGMITFCVRSPR